MPKPLIIARATIAPSLVPFGGGVVQINASVQNATQILLDVDVPGVFVAVTLPKNVAVKTSRTFTIKAVNWQGKAGFSPALAVTVAAAPPPPVPPPAPAPVPPAPAPSPSAAVTIERTGVGYADFNAAQASAQDGDVLLMAPGQDHGGMLISRNALTVKSAVDGQRFGAWAIQNDESKSTQNIIISGAEFKFRKQHPNFYYGPDNAIHQRGGIIWDGNTTGAFTIRNCYFEEMPIAILTSRHVTDVVVEDCEFVNVGSTDDPASHGAYIHATNRLTWNRNKIRWTYSIPEGTKPIPSAAPYNADKTWVGIGHGLKSRSRDTVVTNSLFDNRLGSMSAMIDMGEAGSFTIEDNVMLEGPYSSNDPTNPSGYYNDTQIISYVNGGPGDANNAPAEWPPGPGVVRRNTIVNGGKPTEQLLRLRGFAPSSLTFSGNVIAYPVADASLYPNNTFYPDDSVFVDPANGDFTLKAKSTPPPATQTPPTSSPTPAPTLPAYLRNRAVGEWFDVGADLRTVAPLAITNYSGGTIRHKDSWFLLKGGGHASTLDNGLYGIRLSADAPAWEVVSPGTPISQIQDPYNNEGRYLDGKMCAGHSAYKDLFLQALDRYVQCGSGVAFGGSGGALAIDAFDWTLKGNASATAGWIPSNGINAVGGYYGLPNWALGDVIYTGDTQYLYKCRIGDTSTTLVGRFSGAQGEKYGCCIADTKRGRLIWGGMLDPTGGAAQQLISINPATAGGSTITLTGIAVSPHTYGGGVYVPTIDRYLLLAPGSSTVYAVDPDSGAVSLFPTSGALGWSSLQVTVLGRFQYLPELQAVVFQEPSDGGYAGRLMMMRTS